MKSTIEHEPTLSPRPSIFDEIGSAPLISVEDTAASDTRTGVDRMDLVLASIKWVFIFLPGATAMHFCLMMISLSLVSGIWPEDHWVQAVAAMVIFSFMVLLGLGRLSDIRYLRVIPAILSSGILSAVAFNIAAIFIGYGSFGWAMFLTLPVTVLFAHLMKTRIDNQYPG